MPQFLISALIFLILFYFYIISIIYLSYQKLSAPKSPPKQWISPNVHPHPMPSQVPPKNSLPWKKFQSNCHYRIQKLISHNHIILFSSNSFAILSIPYLKFKKMNHPTSPRQHKKIQKALKGQGKSFPGNSKSETFLPPKPIILWWSILHFPQI